MIQYEERIGDAADVLRGEFGVNDDQAVECLLAARIDCCLPYPWFILETPYYRLVPDGSWFAALYPNTTLPLPILRTVRPRKSNVQVQEMMRDRDIPRVFIEPYYEMPATTAYQFKMWPYLMQECIRLRLPYPKTALPDERAFGILTESVRRVLDTRWRTNPEHLTLPKPPPALPYWCELLQRLSPTLRDWDSLLTSLCALAGRRAYLFNRHVDSTDWDCVSRVMRDSVPVWVKDIAGNVGARGRLKSMRGKYNRGILEGELKRLLEQGVVMHHKGDWLIRDVENRGRDLLELMEGPNICCN